jgi:hydroxymethylpyrimidine/phosphomethylpyrimidine kinase
MSKRRQLPVALTIAGSDSGGGAGIQADLKTFASLGVHGVSAVTCMTAQNPKHVIAIEPCKPEFVRAQLEAVFEELPPAAVKTGMLYSKEITRLLVDWFSRRNQPPLVVDPVMAAASGAEFIENSSALEALRELLPRSVLVTPNLAEAGMLIGAKKLGSVEDMRYAARQLEAEFGCAALVKGGHLRGYRQAVDIYYDGRAELLLEAPFIRGVPTHGTGCTYSAAIAAWLARGLSLPASVQRAKDYVSQAIAESYRAGATFCLNTSVREPISHS